MVAPLVVGASEHELLWLYRRDEAHRDETVVVPVGQAAKEDPVDHAENGGGGPDSQHQGQDDGDGEDRIAAKAADGVSRVLKERFEVIPGPLFPAFLPCSLHTSERNY